MSDTLRCKSCNCTFNVQNIQTIVDGNSVEIQLTKCPMCDSTDTEKCINEVKQSKKLLLD